MNNSNIIISVIIVLCIAAGVTAYSLTNDDNVFTDLEEITQTSGDEGELRDNGIGHTSNGDIGTKVAPSSSSSSGSSSNNEFKKHETPYRSSSSSGSSSSNGSDSKYISPSKAKSIASLHIAEPGCHIKSVSLVDDVYHCYVINKNGKIVDSITINAVNGKLIGRG